MISEWLAYDKKEVPRVCKTNWASQWQAMTVGRRINKRTARKRMRELGEADEPTLKPWFDVHGDPVTESFYDGRQQCLTVTAMEHYGALPY